MKCEVSGSFNVRLRVGMSDPSGSAIIADNAVGSMSVDLTPALDAGGRLLVEVEAEASGTYTAGWSGRGPSYSDGGLPPEPPEIEDLRVVIDGGVDVASVLDDNEVERIVEALIGRAES